MDYIFKFQGGVTNCQFSTVKFLLFLVNGGKELPLYEAKKYQFVCKLQKVDHGNI